MKFSDLHCKSQDKRHSYECLFNMLSSFNFNTAFPTSRKRVSSCHLKIKLPFSFVRFFPKWLPRKRAPATFGTTRRRTSTVSCSHYAASRSRRFATTCREPARTSVNPGGLTRSPPCGSNSVFECGQLVDLRAPNLLKIKNRSV